MLLFVEIVLNGGAKYTKGALNDALGVIKAKYFHSQG
jgi:hypothetical protein